MSLSSSSNKLVHTLFSIGVCNFSWIEADRNDIWSIMYLVC